MAQQLPPLTQEEVQPWLPRVDRQLKEARMTQEQKKFEAQRI